MAVVTLVVIVVAVLVVPSASSSVVAKEVAVGAVVSGLAAGSVVPGA
jgi:hypothetical protein